tara:strand:- start:1840 stop:2277 length:438 start_codon:yes stop_codon:yes gene_type:complete
MNKLFLLAKDTITKEGIEGNFIDRLRCRGYLNQGKKVTDKHISFIKELFIKGYINQDKYNKIYNYYQDNKTVKMSDKKVKCKSEVNINESKETYEILEDEYIDYESVQIDGKEYYLHKENMNIINITDYGDMGYWDRTKNIAVFK